MFDDKMYPNRPDHHDYWRLSELVLQVDAQATEDGRRLDNIVAEIIDPESLAYTAFQRAIRVLGVNTRGQVAARMGDIAKLATVYHEGFILGARFESKRKDAQ